MNKSACALCLTELPVPRTDNAFYNIILFGNQLTLATKSFSITYAMAFVVQHSLKIYFYICRFSSRNFYQEYQLWLKLSKADRSEGLILHSDVSAIDIKIIYIKLCRKKDENIIFYFLMIPHYTTILIKELLKSWRASTLRKNINYICIWLHNNQLQVILTQARNNVSSKFVLILQEASDNRKINTPNLRRFPVCLWFRI